MISIASMQVCVERNGSWPGDSTPPAKQNTKLYSSPPGKVAPAHADISDNNLEIRSADCMKSLSGVKYDLMMVGHIFLNEHVPKDYVSIVWKTIVDNNILVEKKALTEQTSDPFLAY